MDKALDNVMSDNSKNSTIAGSPVDELLGNSDIDAGDGGDLMSCFDLSPWSQDFWLSFVELN